MGPSEILAMKALLGTKCTKTDAGVLTRPLWPGLDWAFSGAISNPSKMAGLETVGISNSPLPIGGETNFVHFNHNMKPPPRHNKP